MPTDEERLNFLQKLTDKENYTGRVVLQNSHFGLGWMLQETANAKAKASVREAIDDFMDAYQND